LSAAFLFLLPVAALGAGAAYQLIGAARDRKRYPPPGRLLQAAGSELHVNSAGVGYPPVLLESGIAASSVNWSFIHNQLAKLTTVTSYDRAGFAWSGKCRTLRTPDRIIAELHAVIQSQESPWILVGHSFGGLIARLYASRYPQNVAGLVLIDPALLLEWAQPNTKRTQMLQRGVRLSRRGATLCRAGVVRLALSLAAGGSRWLPGAISRASSGRGSSVINRMIGEVRKMPSEYWPAIQSHWSRPECFESMAQHLEALPAMAKEVASTRTPGDLPVVVISGAHSDPAALEEHRGIARLSPRGKHVIAAAGGHWVHLDEPETVLREIREMIDHVRAGSAS
jgi:pimeloyl-ACP methyl ester carboxylesterase